MPRLPEWLLELAEQVRMIKPGTLLPTGVIVGSAVIEKVTGPVAPRSQGLGPYYQWHLVDVKRLSRPRKPSRQPQPAWFRPF